MTSQAPRARVELVVDGRSVAVPEGSTLLEACRTAAVETPTLCYLETLRPANACRVCVVELEDARTLAPACSRLAEPGMVVTTDSERVRHSRRMVLELLASSADLSLAGEEVAGWLASYGADPDRHGSPAPAAEAGTLEARRPGHHPPPHPGAAATVAQPVKVQDDLYVRDYGRCILCYRCVDACGEDAQNTFAIAVAGRGFDARISTEFDVDLPTSACVYCGNCIGVCPTGALMAKTEFDMRRQGTWAEDRQAVTRTVCPYCGVGCNLDLVTQDGRIVKVTSPIDHDVTAGHLCIKGRFGWQFVHGESPDGG